MMPFNWRKTYICATCTRQQQQQKFINRQIKLQKYCPQLAKLFEAGQCMKIHLYKIKTKAIN